MTAGLGGQPYLGFGCGGRRRGGRARHHHRGVVTGGKVVLALALLLVVVGLVFLAVYEFGAEPGPGIGRGLDNN